MNYELVVDPHALRQLEKLTPDQRKRIYPALLKLETNPRPPGAKKLVGEEGWRIRIGSFRALYHVDDAECSVTVFDIDTRARIYRKRR